MNRIQVTGTTSRRLTILFTLVVAVVASVLTAKQLSVGKGHRSPTRVLGVHLVANNGCGNGNNGPSGSKDCNTPGKTFTMAGTSSGLLAPGVERTLTVRVNNPNAQDMYVAQITTTVGSPTNADSAAGKPACSASWVVAPGYKYSGTGTQYVSPARSFVDVPLSITMTDLRTVNQDNCKGAQFPITLTATADQVH
jgi:hypothetical protein